MNNIKKQYELATKLKTVIQDSLLFIADGDTVTCFNDDAHIVKNETDTTWHQFTDYLVWQCETADFYEYKKQLIQKGFRVTTVETEGIFN